MIHSNKIALIGVALGLGAQKTATELGPKRVYESKYVNQLIHQGDVHWQTTLYPKAQFSNPLSYPERLSEISELSLRLAQTTALAIEKGEFPLVMGGDHSMAIGTWSGIIMALKAQRQFGLIWFDAHMDAHTPNTSSSMAIHGMPVAVLLGQGEETLVNTYAKGAKLDPRHLVLMGPRDFEKEEAAYLTQLGVKIFSTEEIQKRGFDIVAKEALEIVSQAPKGFGVSLDLDGFDPNYAPGTGSHAPNGLVPKAIVPGLKKLLTHSQCQGFEIAEFNPQLDINHQTLHLIETLIRQIIK